MKTFVLILAMLVAPLGAQNKQPQNTAPPQTAAQSTPEAAAQQAQSVAKSTAKPAQPPLPQQPIVFTAKQLDEYEDKILDRAEGFYNNRMSDLLWMMGVLMGIVGVGIPLVISGFIQWQRKISFTKELLQVNEKILESTKEQIKELETELISQINAREEEQTEGIGSNLAYLFTQMGGLSLSLKTWDMAIKSFFLAIRVSIAGQCFDSCFKISGHQIVQLLENPEITNSLTLDSLRNSDEDIECIKVLLGEIADTEQRVRMESQVKELQILVYALLHEKQHDADTAPPQAEP